MHRILKLAAILAVVMVSTAPAQANGGKFTLSSTDAHAGQMLKMPQVFNAMGCTGGNMSPEIEWSGAPATAKSFALTIYDPDAPTGSGWWHWVVYNIPANVKKIPAGAGSAGATTLPAGAKQGNTDFGTPGYGGACPPAGDKAHHYVFTLFALDVASLDIPSTATAAYIGFNLHGHTVATATFTALYQR